MQKFGMREICNVVLKARAAQKIGKKIFYKNEPVMYFETLKTSSLEGQSSTVYAQGGRGNPRLVAWEGERTVTFTMEDALISAESLSILTGAGLIDAKDKKIYQHVTEIIDKSDLDITSIESGLVRIPLSNRPYLPDDAGENFGYVMFMKEGEIITEPYIPVHGESGDNNTNGVVVDNSGSEVKYWITVADHNNYVLPSSYADLSTNSHNYAPGELPDANAGGTGSEGEPTYDVREFPFVKIDGKRIDTFDSVLVDYYVERSEGAT
jgi:hypothetical protein